MRQIAIDAALDLLGIAVLKIAPAFIPQKIQRAKTKQTVEVFFFRRFMTWKIFTFFVLKKPVVIIHKNPFTQIKQNKDQTEKLSPSFIPSKYPLSIFACSNVPIFCITAQAASIIANMIGQPLPSPSRIFKSRHASIPKARAA